MPDATKPLLEIRDLRASYGRIEVLHGVSLHVDPGEVVAIIGPNGAGKSTVFRTMMGFVRCTGGDMAFKGCSLRPLPSYEILRRGLAYVPQGRLVFRDMTVLENLKMGAFIEPDRQKVRQALERTYALFPILHEKRQQKAGTLSGGQQQVLAISRALMVEPTLILLDEPSLGLAPNFAQFIFERLLALQEHGITIMMVEQNAAKALEIADRGYVLELGNNRYSGRGRDLLHDPEVKRLYLGG